MYSQILPVLVIVGVSQCAPDDVADSTCRLIRRYHCDFFAPDPHCGTDGITYHNMCEFSKAHCEVRTLHVAHPGNCTASSSGGSGVDGVHSPGDMASYSFFCQTLSQQACGPELQVVCGSDGVTYNNLCLFEKARCHNNTMAIADYQACPN